ncbi:MAG: monovalent cation:proton antiporter-2 (CPA2) family protein [Thalassolituus sp.]|jgi:glutathione-regulated potassium-efflux system ancillary protein KefC|uniref:monovalent cation:proton antiporter-2 (CPA2) family protein n=2 Tax=Thalassolituus TaxID=187492 RepID=UPI0023B3B2EE|nr:monovalent cation:proton antiporter-2 (CPA2) family protein [Thalassolituus sp.]MDQ4423329.1 monovalent cation:proton antiporter-2 (CPA2) family protein [Thalassolituus sp.]MDQ4425995.1 monovalent cation:proton antiporter-2 (CPA2) family protein [Thalassolituus sp.]
MHEAGFLMQAFVFLAAAVIAVPIAARLGLGSVLGYLCAGAVIGPFALGLIGQDIEEVMHFAEFGVVMMLFLVGLELDPSKLWRMRVPIVGMGGLQVVITSAVIAGIALVYLDNWQHAVVVGMVLSLSSTAIVLQTLNEKGLMKNDSGQSAFAVLLFQDIAVIPMLAVLPLLAVAEVGTFSDKHNLPGYQSALMVLGAVVGIVVVGRWLSRSVFRIIAETRLREMFTATALFLVVGIALLMEHIGLSPALGTFVAGVVLANSEYRHELEAEVEPFKGLLLALFFISVGASIDFALLMENPWPILAMVGGLVLVKLVVLLILGKAFGLSSRSNAIFTFSLAQAGEFAFVLFSFAAARDVLPAYIIDPLTLVVALSMALTPLLFVINERLVLPRLRGAKALERAHDAIKEPEGKAILVGFGRFGQIVGRLLRMNGFEITVLEHDAAQVDLVRNFGHKVYYGDAARMDLLETAGIEDVDLLVLAIDDHQRMLKTIHQVKRHHPDIKILARAAGRREAAELLHAGADHIERETFDSALSMGRKALSLMGFRAYQAQRAAQLFKHHDKKSLFALSEVIEDDKKYLTVAKQHATDLEKVLKSDDQANTELDDRGWDSGS